MRLCWITSLPVCLGLSAFLGGCDLRGFWGGTFLQDEGDMRCSDPSLCPPCDGGNCMPPPVTARCAGPQDCPQSHICRVDASYPGDGVAGVGSCLPASRVCVVDASACTEMRDGSAAHPFCDITEAPGRCSFARLVARQDGARYGTLVLSTGSLAVFGAGRDVAEAVISGVQVSGSGTSLTLFDALVSRPGAYAVQCTEGALASLRRVAVQGSTIGVYASGCGHISLDQSRVTGNQNDGIDLMIGTQEYRIVNSLVANNGLDTGAYAVGVYIATVAQGTAQFSFNTVVGNGRKAPAYGGVTCGNRTHLNDSIVVGNTTGANGSQFSSGCEFSNVVVDQDSTVAPGVIKMAPNLDGQTFHLTEQSTCCIDTAVTDPMIRYDYEGTARPQRLGYDIGFHELPPAGNNLH